MKDGYYWVLRGDEFELVEHSRSKRSILMTYEDVRVLRELHGSVYLTPRQREALGRALGRVVRGAPPLVVKTVDTSLTAEAQRLELLGPLGAE